LLKFECGRPHRHPIVVRRNLQQFELCFVVTMTNQKGEPAQDDAGKVYTHKLEPGDDAYVIAGRLTRKLRDALRGKKDAPPAGFGAPLNYSKSGIY
jgi:hypothetical protein